MQVWEPFKEGRDDPNSNFQLHHRYFLSKVSQNVLYFLLFSGKNFRSLLRCSSEQLCVYILSSKGATQLQVLYIRTLRNIKGNFLHGILFHWSCSPQTCSQKLFFGKCKSFRTTSKKLVLENSVLLYQTADKDHVEILQTVFPRFCFLFFVSYINQNHKNTTHSQGRGLDATLYIDQNVSQNCQLEFLKILRMRIYLFKKDRKIFA